jgi:hypothetical protein
VTLEDLRKSLQNFMPEWCEIERADDGEIVIRTGLIETTTGELVPIDDAEVSDE